MPHSFGYRARTRDMFCRPFRKSGVIKLSTYMQTFKRGDYVDIKAHAAVHKGMPHKHYHGRTGIVFNITKRAVGVRVNKLVRRVARRSHLRCRHFGRMRCRQPPADNCADALGSNILHTTSYYIVLPFTHIARTSPSIPQVNGKVLEKRIHVRVEHVIPSKCRIGHIQRVKDNEAHKKAVRENKAEKVRGVNQEPAAHDKASPPFLPRPYPRHPSSSLLALHTFKKSLKRTPIMPKAAYFVDYEGTEPETIQPIPFSDLM